MSESNFGNVVQALCFHYNLSRQYDSLIAPVTDRLSQHSTLFCLAGAGAAIAATAYLVKLSRRAAHMKRVEQCIQNAQQRRAGEFDAVKSQLLSSPVAEQDEQAINHEIDNDGPYAVFQAVRERRFRLQDVVRVYQKRCIRAQEICNPITHMMVNAVDEAVKFEDRLQRGEPLPPLYGLVFSVKEMYGVAGTDSTLGLTARQGELATKDSTIVQTMREMGAVLLCKTNFPQTLLSFASSNPMYGLTRNPYDNERGPGGSSSGEGALLALNGTMLGWGSDIGGSVRIPANFCGISSFKPVADRFCGRGVVEVFASSKSVISTYGMLSRDVRLITTVHRLLLNSENGLFKDDPAPLAPTLPWRDALYNDQKPLRIGYFVDDGFFPCMPGIKRAVHLATLCLKENGHTLVPFKVPEAQRAIEVFIKLIWGDRLRDCYECLRAEKIDPNLQGLYDLACTVQPSNGSWLARQSALAKARKWSQRHYIPLKKFYKLETPEDLSLAIRQGDEYRAQFLDECRKLNLDVLLCPVTPYPALKLGAEKDTLFSLSYTIRFNLLNLPAGVVTITSESVEDQRALDGYPETDEELKMLKCSARGALGMPLGVQVASCNPYREKVALRVLNELQQSVGKAYVTKLPQLQV